MPELSKQFNDHDLIIELHTKMDSICKSNTELNKKISVYMSSMSLKCDKRLDTCVDRLDKKLGSETFWKTVAILTILFGVVFTSIGLNTKILISNSEKIKTNSSHMDKIMGYFEK